MRKTQVALAALALVASTAVMAAEVSISGVIDIGVGSTSKNADGVGGSYMENGAFNDHSGIDLNVSEDMGSGLKAYVSLGMGFNPNGQSDNPGTSIGLGNANNGLFNRQSFVGLSSDMGSLQLGKQLSPYVLSNVMMMNYNGMFGVGRMTMVPGGTAGAFFVGDAVQYQAPSVGGFTVTAMTSMADSTRGNGIYTDTLFANQGYTAVSVMGAIGPFNATAAHHTVRNTLKGSNIGGTIDLIDGLKASVGYMTGTNEGEQTVKSWNLGGAYSLTSSLTLSAQYASRSTTAEVEKASLTNIMLAQALSKRTTIYGTYGKGKGIGAGIGTWATHSEAGVSNNAFVVGVSHSF